MEPSTATEFLKYPICFIIFFIKERWLLLYKMLNIYQVNHISNLSVPLGYFPCTVLNVWETVSINTYRYHLLNLLIFVT